MKEGSSIQLNFNAGEPQDDFPFRGALIAIHRSAMVYLPKALIGRYLPYHYTPGIDAQT